MLHHELLNAQQFDQYGIDGPLGSYGEPWSPYGAGYVGTTGNSGAGAAV